MATNDDRPISVYDNLNAILPPQQCSTPKTPTVTMSTSTTSPYADISFKFDASKAQKQPSQSIYTTSPNNASNQSSINATSPLHYTPSNSNSPYSQVNKTAFQSGQPLSQHSDTNGYSSIAAVKAALNDAKSKFFGLNGSSTNDTVDTNQESLLSNNGAVQKDQKPKIVPKSQPKYQNIPENSAIFRNAEVSSPAPPPPPPLPPPLPPMNDSFSNTPETSRPSTNYSPNSSPISSTGQHSKFKGSTNSVQYSTIQHRQIAPDMDFGISSQPSQAVYMATTVPQNIKGSKIAGRHTPTRNSLRHSRMLVVNKNYQGTSYTNPMGFRCPRLTRVLLILEVIIGILITFLGVWILLLAPHTEMQDNPYWSGLALLLAGILGLILIRYKRIKRHKLRENCFIFVKLDSYILSILAAVLCLIAVACAAIHMNRLSATDTKCISSDILMEQASCKCTFNANSIQVSNGTPSDLNPASDSSYLFQYRDLSCSEVSGIWMSILGCSIVLNCIGFVLACIYLMLLFFFRYREVYSSVQTSVF